MLVRFFKQSWLVLASALVFGLLVAAVNGQLEEKIAANARLKLERAMQALLGTDRFEDISVGDEQGIAVTYHLGRDENGAPIGYAIQAQGGGFADKITLLVALDAGLQNYRGIAVLKTNETPGFGDKIKNEPFKGQFSNCPAAKKLVVVKTGDPSIPDNEIVAITGATISSDAVVKIVNNAKLQLQTFMAK